MSLNEPYSEAWLQAKSEENWARVDPEKRKLCVEHLRSVIPAEELADLSQDFHAGFDNWWHFSGGMSVRNILREVMLDDELPGVKYDHIEGSPEFKNWDDFYMAALRQAVAPKEGEE